MAKETKVAAPAAETAAPKGPSAAGLGCLFSGEPTITKNARFLPGYDAKMKSLLLRIVRGEAKISEIRKEALPFLKSEAGLCGFKLVNGELTIVGKFKLAEPKPKKVKAEKTAPAAKPTAAASTPVTPIRRVVRRPAASAVAEA